MEDKNAEVIEMTEEELKKTLAGIMEGTDEEKPLFITDILLMDEDALSEMISSEDFKEGQKAGYEIAGIFTTLVNCGMAYGDCMDITLNYQTMKHNKKLQEIVNDGASEVAEKTKKAIEKTVL